jgi:hypothetical protein
MGLRDRIKGRLKSIREGAKEIHEEARHPGRPAPHMVPRNKLWAAEEGKSPPPPPEQASKQEIDPFKRQDAVKEDQEFWFLEGDNEGWDQTNPIVEQQENEPGTDPEK